MADDETNTQGTGTAAVSPKDTATGRVTPTDGPSNRPGTEAEEATSQDGHDSALPGDGPGRAGERAAAYQENDA